MSAFQEQPIPTYVPDTSKLTSARYRTANGGVVTSAGFESAGDGGGNTDWIYHRSGKSLITIGPFFKDGPGADDYWEAVDKANVTCYQAGASNSKTASENHAALQAVASLGVSIEFPPGADISIDDQLVCANGTSIWGHGWASILRQTTASKNLIAAGNSSLVDGMHLIGYGVVAGGAFEHGNGITIIGKHNVTVADCFIEQCQHNGVYFANSSSVNIRDNTFFANVYDSPSGADVVLYSSIADSGLITIANNKFYSNNSAAVFLDAQGYDSRITVIGNMCVALDPATCTVDGTWAELADEPSIERRHGIVCGYGGSSKDIQVIGNTIKNTRWTAIYKLGLSSGPILIQNNLCINNGFDAEATVPAGFASGILVRPYGGEIISGNTIVGCRGLAFGAIYITGSVPNTKQFEVSNNTIIDSNASGIFLTDYAYNGVIKGNVITGSATYDIASLIPPGEADAGGHVIFDNVCRRTNTNYPSIILGIGESTKTMVVHDNHLFGFDNSVADALNSGIRIATIGNLIQVRRNFIDGFHHGIYHSAYWTGRVSDYCCEYNTVVNCTNGIDISCGSAGDANVLLRANDLRRCDNELSNSLGYAAGIQGELVSDFMHLYARSAPSVGTWARGDMAWNTEPRGLSSLGWVCKDSGSPGNWERFGGNSAPVTSPEQLIGLEWWLDASDVATITDVGGRVTAWADKSGNGREVVNTAGDTTRPITGATTINGLNVLDVTAGQYRSLSSALELPLIEQPFHMFVVFNSTSNPDGGRVVNGITLANRAFIWADTTWTLAAGYENVLDTDIDSTATGNYFISGMFNDTASKMWVNDNAPQSVSPGYGKLGGLRVNGAYDNSGFHIDGSICEVIVCSFDNSDNVSAIKDYLVAKWGLTF